MKKSLALLSLSAFLIAGSSYAEDAAAPMEVAAEETAAAAAEIVSAAPEAVAETLGAVPVAEPQDATLVDNLEFISGEVSELDETGKSVSVRLYGESEDATSDKVLKVTIDENTDITDGEQDRDLKSLAAGTEVDVEYDPATNKATYIFVY
jgi:hypothetical protein